jgi:5-methylthioadenosine/S-adenosylhomocysteine deaminase
MYSHLVFAANGSAVDTTVVNGQVVMRDRHLTTLDEGRIRPEANRAFQRVLDRMKTPS